MPNPFSDNIIFLDTEFSDLDPYKGELLSIGMVKPGGEELYLEIDYEGEVNDWVRQNVVPHLTGPKLSRNEARSKIREFVGDSEPYLVSYVNQFDAIYWYKLFGMDDHPAYRIPIDFASMLFGLGIDPAKYSSQKFLSELGIDGSKYKKHNALEDAKLLREIYLSFFGKYGDTS